MNSSVSVLRHPSSSYIRATVSTKKQTLQEAKKSKGEEVTPEELYGQDHSTQKSFGKAYTENNGKFF